ncbi:hypothetical protein HanXRQr2_Chr16g0738141 [Helianthus annuus]|uniref:Uncharacterized protein n=1 Tax=Helianthus annuus TaxID=4232 RepID=A0A9K3DRU5_HELAN|nr:hypothetical protein HanXRQr2_Chr16g0738141 [Helianthus annuus]KAJ0820405.1 hypothetical protein HanPSC8_Chr16g0707651 [Helianthus annuus]
MSVGSEYGKTTDMASTMVVWWWWYVGGGNGGVGSEYNPSRWRAITVTAAGPVR